MIKLTNKNMSKEELVTAKEKEDLGVLEGDIQEENTIESLAISSKQGIPKADKHKVTDEEYEKIREECVQLQDSGVSLRQISEAIFLRHDVRMNKDSIATVIQKWRKEQINLENLNDIAYQRVVTLGELDNLQNKMQRMLQEKVVTYKVSQKNKATGTWEIIDKRVEIKPHVLVSLFKVLQDNIIAKAKIRGIDNSGIMVQIMQEYNLQQNNLNLLAGNDGNEKFSEKILSELKQLSNNLGEFGCT